MTPTDFLIKVRDYYGAWSQASHKAAVWEYVKTKNPPFLRGMWDVLTERRRPEEGPVSLPVLLGLAADAANRMPAPRLLDDGEYLPRQEAHTALAEALKRALEGKVQP